MSEHRRPRSVPLLATAAAIVLGGVVVTGILLGSGVGAQPAGAVAAITGRPSVAVRSTPRPTPEPSPSPSPSPSATPVPTPTPTAVPTPPPTPKPVLAMNLYRKGDFVSQATKEQCMSAAMQIMLNIVGPKNDRTARTQARIDRLATELSDGAPGATEPIGWARGLAKLGAGGYRVEIADSRKQAILRGVNALRRTGRPVGLLVWRGAHSWVLHGYESTADPLSGKPFEVTHIYVSDPWYPRISSIWGRSRGPNARITPKQLEEDYLPWRRPTGRYPGMDGKFILVLPVDR